MGLRKNDLQHLIDDVFEIDSYSSKMGSDQDIVTISFSLSDKQPADDLVKFLESGYSFILDADVSAGELENNTFKVFVEIERDKNINRNIVEMLDGIKKLTGEKLYKYRYYKNFKSREAKIENLQNDVPIDAESYISNKDTITMENYENFFKDSYIESVHMNDNTIILEKLYSQPLRLEFIDVGNTNEILSKLQENFNPWDFAEVIYLSKYIGDYNITKYGNKLTFENKNITMVAKRII